VIALGWPARHGLSPPALAARWSPLREWLIVHSSRLFDLFSDRPVVIRTADTGGEARLLCW